MGFVKLTLKFKIFTMYAFEKRVEELEAFALRAQPLALPQAEYQAKFASLEAKIAISIILLILYNVNMMLLIFNSIYF